MSSESITAEPVIDEFFSREICLYDGEDVHIMFEQVYV